MVWLGCEAVCWVVFFFFFQAEDGIRDLVRSRGLGDVYKRQRLTPEDITAFKPALRVALKAGRKVLVTADHGHSPVSYTHLTLPTIYSV